MTSTIRPGETHRTEEVAGGLQQQALHMPSRLSSTYAAALGAKTRDGSMPGTTTLALVSGGPSSNLAEAVS
ncbi:hypothetical protein [Bradyrhizobium sp. AUGA SZCCT0283]|uniref:hypothetical protein n=1 Tax=Bradyrhizobium sp. AUGA SZCCT0283 TaxID=2807671 RepID=UPI001BA50A82|nr:hypothetical protein [Bradyrhizobium sp. AUGA SZCCT0283]MBR1279112.1 hypothetical protein [Bradyrhizobium sp. AUGA SZCCT0283]